MKYAVRTLLRAPGFAIAAILTLALGIGATTAIFSVADAVILRPLPYPSSNRLVVVWDNLTRLGVERLGLLADVYRDYSRQGVFEKTAAYRAFDRNFNGAEFTERVPSIIATPSLLEMLGAKPELGRIFAMGDAENVAVISHSLFAREFGANPAAIGKTFRLDDRGYTLIGVLPSQFSFGTGATPTDIWTPLFSSRMNDLRMLGLLQPGVSLEATRSAIDAAAKHLNETLHPHWGPNGEDPGFRSSVVSLHDELLGSFRSAMLILLGAVAAVLLIACANVANLLLVRAVAREKETAMRRALGATEGRLIRQWLTEAAMLALAGGTLGSIAAVWGVRALIALSPSAIPTNVGVDSRALLFTLTVSAVACFFFGLVPSLAGSKIAWRGSPRRRRAASLLITAEVALALTLLVSAGLLLKSFSRLRHVDPGFNPQHVLTMRVQYPPTRPFMKTQLAAFFTDLCDRVARIPGVISAGAVTNLPVGGSINGRGGNPFSIEGQQWRADGPVPQMAHTQTIDPDYFHAMQIPLLRGRFFTAGDNSAAPAVTVVNETLARGFFPRGAIGHQIMLGAPRPDGVWLTIIGVVGDVKMAALSLETMPQFYTPLAQDPSGAMSLVIRTARDPATIAQSAARAVRAGDPSLIVYDVSTMDDRIARSIGQPRFEATLLTLFAASALFLAAIGIFGVVAHSTAQRTQEIGIRMALGADRARVVETVFLDGMRPVAFGVLIGIAGALGLGSALSTILFEVSKTDPSIFIFSAVGLILVASIACLAPARRATRVDPMTALRHD